MTTHLLFWVIYIYIYIYILYKEIIEFCFFACVLEKYTINILTIKDAIIVNFIVYIKSFHINVGQWRNLNNTHSKSFCLYRPLKYKLLNVNMYFINVLIFAVRTYFNRFLQIWRSLIRFDKKLLGSDIHFDQNHILWYVLISLILFMKSRI